MIVLESLGALVVIGLAVGVLLRMAPEAEWWGKRE